MKFRTIHYHEEYQRKFIPKLKMLASKKTTSDQVIGILTTFYILNYTIRKPRRNQFNLQFNSLVNIYKEQIPEIFGNIASFMLDHKELDIKVLKQYQSGSLTLTKSQVCYLVCSMALNLIPIQQFSQSQKFPNMTDFAFIFQQDNFKTQTVITYLKDFFKHTITNKEEMNQKMTIQRQILDQNLVSILKEKGDYKMSKFDVVSNQSSIQDYYGHIKVDFANKYIGGGVLGHGCVQQQIMFANRPQILTSLLLCEVMATNQSLFFIGFKKYSKNTGYGWTTKYDGQQTKIYDFDQQNRAKQYITAIDAIHFRKNDKSQFTKQSVNRELTKAYCGFNVPIQCKVITGNWGCGAFNGDIRTKFLIQWIACSLAEKEMIYCPYGSQGTILQNKEIFDNLKNMPVKQVYKLLINSLSKVENAKTNIFQKIAQFFEKQ